jgi:tetratricopeptide (TPR) repeat protein
MEANLFRRHPNPDRIRRMILLACVLGPLVADGLPQQRAVTSQASPTVAAQASAISQRAMEEFQRGEFERAAQDFGTVCNIDRRDARAHLGLGLSLASMGKLEPAHGALNQANTLTPGNIQIMLALAKVEIGLGHHQRARTRLREAGKIQPDNPQVGLLMVESYLAAKENGRAVAESRGLSARFAQNAAVQAQLGLMFLRAGVFDESERRLDLTHKLDAAAADKALEQALRELPGAPEAHLVILGRFRDWNRLEVARHIMLPRLMAEAPGNPLFAIDSVQCSVLAGDTSGLSQREC